jgi:PAS domain-containing protein
MCFVYNEMILNIYLPMRYISLLQIQAGLEPGKITYCNPAICQLNGYPNCMPIKGNKYN